MANKDVDKDKLARSAEKKNGNKCVYSKHELEELCSIHHVPTSGKKEELVRRLMDALFKEKKMQEGETGENKEPNYDKIIRNALDNTDNNMYINVDTGRAISSKTVLKKKYKNSKYGLAGTKEPIFNKCIEICDTYMESLLSLIIEHKKSGKDGYINIDTTIVLPRGEAIKLYNEEKLRFCTARERVFSIILDEDDNMYHIESLATGISSSDPSGQVEGAKTRQSEGRSRVCLTIRSRVWRKYNGGVLDSTCYCCDGALSFENFEAGHVIARVNGGTMDISNIKPVCRSCNRSMGTMNMKEFAKREGLEGRISKE